MTLGTCVDGDIQLGDLLLNTVDADGVRWIVTDVEGWWTIPEPDIPDFPMAADDGSYETAGRYQARIFTLIGSFLPPNQAAVAPARAKLIRAADLCRQATWFLTRSEGLVVGSRVVLSGSPQITTLNATGRTDFAIGLKAPDPVKYAINNATLPGYFSASRVGNGTLDVVNEGDYPVRAIVRVEGPSDGEFTITNSATGDVMKFRNPIADGNTLVVDNQLRTVTMEIGATVKRNQRFYLYWDTDWLSLAPGTNTLTVAGEPGATVTVQWRHGWIG